MALLDIEGPASHLIHHSDRGLQYCSKEYVGLLNKYDIQISMIESGDPLENPIVERIHGIMKEEYLDVQVMNSVKQAIKYLHEAIRLFNSERPHMSISNLTQVLVHHASEPIEVKRLWKNYYFKRRIL